MGVSGRLVVEVWCCGWSWCCGVFGCVVVGLWFWMWRGCRDIFWFVRRSGWWKWVGFWVVVVFGFCFCVFKFVWF